MFLKRDLRLAASKEKQAPSSERLGLSVNTLWTQFLTISLKEQNITIHQKSFKIIVIRAYDRLILLISASH